MADQGGGKCDLNIISRDENSHTCCLGRILFYFFNSRQASMGLNESACTDSESSPSISALMGLIMKQCSSFQLQAPGQVV